MEILIIVQKLSQTSLGNSGTFYLSTSDLT